LHCSALRDLHVSTDVGGISTSGADQSGIFRAHSGGSSPGGPARTVDAGEPGAKSAAPEELEESEMPLE